MKHIAYPKTVQFRNVVQNINKEISFVGIDENGNAIHDETLPKPVLTFHGTVKLHGTNASFCYNHNDGFWAQSRNNVITPKKDNAAFAFFCETNQDVMKDMIEYLAENNKVDLGKHTITVYGEWAGKGVQSGAGIAEVEKTFFIFAAKVSEEGNADFIPYWIDSGALTSRENRIYRTERKTH